MDFTAEELAIYGLIEADTYIRLSEAIIPGVTHSAGVWPRLDRKTRKRIRVRTVAIWRERVARSTGS